MLALIVSYILLAYLLVPRAIFRSADIFLPLKFQRTRTAEVTFAFLISFIPLVVAVCLSVALYGRPNHATLDNYRELFAASYSEASFDKAPQEFWRANQNVMVQQWEFLGPYYILVLIEACGFVLLLRKYGNWHSKCRTYKWIVQNLLLRSVNEWHVLLTLFNFPQVPERKVTADLLTQEDHLYQGDVAQYFLDGDGALSGLFLVNPLRFDRAGYLREREKDLSVKPESYWRKIPSAALYIPREKILSLNLRYPTVEPTPTEAETLTRELLKSGIQLKVEISRDEPNADDQRPKD